MKLNPGPRTTGPVVTGFSCRGFKIDGRPTEGGVLLTPDWSRPWDGKLTEASLEPLVVIAPEFILIGTGPVLDRPPRELAAYLDSRGIGIEAMDSRAAARAWSLLRGEGRWIAAALLPL